MHRHRAPGLHIRTKRPYGTAHFTLFFIALKSVDLALSFILLRDRVTIDGIWTDNWIYWTLNSGLHFTNHCHTKISVLSHGLLCAAW
jgi:hypothetical protein